MSIKDFCRGVNRITVLAALLAGFVVPQLHVMAKDWSRYRGVDLNGISTENVSGDLKIAWKAKIGLGHSAFVVANGLAVVSGNDGENTDTLWAFDAETGEVKWKHSYEHPVDALYYAGGTTATATFDGDTIYHWARRGQLFSLEATTGKVNWQKLMTEDFGYDMPTWGFTGAPLVIGGRLYLNAGDAGIVLDKSDGSVVWKSDNGEAGYSTPHPFERDGKQYMLFSNKRGYVCVDPETGEEIWRFKWLTRYGVNASDPIVTDEHLFISTGYGKGATLLKWTGSGEPEEVWRNREMKNQMNPCILIGDYVYGIDGDQSVDRTGLKCLELNTGEVKWLDESVAHGAISAAGDNLIVLTEQGELRIGPASPEGFNPTAKVQVLPAKCWTVPVLANGKIYCRSDKGEVAVVEVER